jgi:uncharacterized membrane protein
MMVLVGVVFLLLNVPPFWLAILEEMRGFPVRISRWQVIVWLVVITAFPAVTFQLGQTLGDAHVLVDVALQGYVVLCWFPVLGVYLLVLRATDIPEVGDPDQYGKLFTVLLVLLCAGLLGVLVWLLLRLSPPAS